MKDNIRTIAVSALMAAAVFLLIGASSALADSDGFIVIDHGEYSLNYSLSGDEATVIGIEDYDKYTDFDINIPETISDSNGKTYKVIAIGDSAFKGLLNSGNLSCPSVETIGDRAFYESWFSSFYCPNVITIGIEAFYSTDLKEINLPNVETINSGAFDKCYMLEKVSCPDVSDIKGNVFSYCSMLTTIEISESNPKYYTDSDALYGRRSESENFLIQFTNRNATSYTAPENMTAVCKSAFFDCRELQTVSLPDTIKISAYAFENCSKLQSVSCPDVEFIGEGAFAMCPALTEIVISPENPHCRIESGALILMPESCLNSASIDIYIDGHDHIIYDFVALDDLSGESGPVLIRYIGSDKTFIVPEDVTSIGADSFSGCAFPETVSCSNVNNIREYAFYESGIKTISGNAVTNIGAGAFMSSESLEAVDFPSAETIGISSFSGCAALERADFPNVKEIGDKAFYDCTMITSLNCPNVLSIGSAAFNDCPLLTTIIISGENPNYAVDKNALYSKDRTALVYFLDKSATEFTVPVTVETVGGEKGSFGAVFSDCQLESIVFPDGVDLGHSIFSNCRSLKQISVCDATIFGPVTLDWPSQEIIIGWNTKEDGSGTFYGWDEIFQVNERMNLYAIRKIEPTPTHNPSGSGHGTGNAKIVDVDAVPAVTPTSTPVAEPTKEPVSKPAESDAEQSEQIEKSVAEPTTAPAANNSSDTSAETETTQQTTEKKGIPALGIAGIISGLAIAGMAARRQKKI